MVKDPTVVVSDKLLPAPTSMGPFTVRPPLAASTILTLLASLLVKAPRTAKLLASVRLVPPTEEPVRLLAVITPPVWLIDPFETRFTVPVEPV